MEFQSCVIEKDGEISFDFTGELYPGSLAEMKMPPKGYQFVLPDGTIYEADGMLFPDESVPCRSCGFTIQITSDVRVGSIYDREGAD